MLKKSIAVFFAACTLILASCSSPTGPTPVPEQSVVVTQPASVSPTPPTVAPPGPEHNAQVKGGFYSITNETGIPQFYCAAAFGVLPGGEQSASTNLFEDQGVRQSKDVFSGQAPKTAACQYQQIQVDLTQSKDCRKFDWTNVLAAEVYANPGYDVTTVTTTYTAWSEWKDSPVADTQEVCYDEYKVEQYRTRTRTNKTCLTTKDTEERETQTITRKREKPCPCEASRFWDQSETHNSNEIKFNVHATGQGTWELKLYAASSLSEYTNNDPDYLKDTDTDVVTKCQNGQTELKVDYNWRYHFSSHWWAVLTLNNVVKWKSPVVVK